MEPPGRERSLARLAIRAHRQRVEFLEHQEPQEQAQRAVQQDSPEQAARQAGEGLRVPQANRVAVDWEVVRVQEGAPELAALAEQPELEERAETLEQGGLQEQQG